MKIMHVYAKVDVDVKLSEEAIKELPKKVGLVTSIQHLEKLKVVQEQLPESIMGGQVLGCRADVADAVKNKFDAFLYLGTGVFHPIKIALATGKKVWCWNPVSKKLTQITDEEKAVYERRAKVSTAKFLSADIIGVLVTTKPGQVLGRIAKPSKNAWQKSVEFLEKKFPDKQFLVFAFDTLNPDLFENFPFVDCWLNFACSRVADEKSNIANFHDIIPYSKF